MTLIKINVFYWGLDGDFMCMAWDMREKARCDWLDVLLESGLVNSVGYTVGEREGGGVKIFKFWSLGMIDLIEGEYCSLINGRNESTD